MTDPPPQRSPGRDPERIAFARNQRRTANEFAQDVWRMVRGGRVLGMKFRREHPIGPYTVDFVCLAIKLVIEVDGKEHLTDKGRIHDAKRDDYLCSLGFEVLRIQGYQVTQDAGAVRQQIERAITKRTLR